MNLSDIFSAVAYKSLVQVDLPEGSHQHEINGSATLKQFFGAEREIAAPVEWFYFADDRESLHDSGEFRFYDARARGAARTGRSEWRLYYTGEFLNCAAPGDLLILARDRKDRTYGLVFQRNSGWLRSVKNLFGIAESETQLTLVKGDSLNASEVEFAKQRILSDLGLEIDLPPRVDDETLVTEKFGFVFPTVAGMSEFARGLIEPDLADPDGTLTAWLEREEQLFRALEKVVVDARLKESFESTDDFLDASLSIHQRRKSRMGLSFENHLAALFDGYNLRYERHAITEGKNKPDFLFPGREEYHDPSFELSRLVMLAAKSTCKDRWRQVLTEADRITVKHLATLEPGISEAQTDEMKLKSVTLVVPKNLLPTYTANQRDRILSINEFIELVNHVQSR